MVWKGRLIIKEANFGSLSKHRRDIVNTPMEAVTRAAESHGISLLTESIMAMLRLFVAKRWFESEARDRASIRC